MVSLYGAKKETSADAVKAGCLYGAKNKTSRDAVNAEVTEPDRWGESRCR